MPMYYVNKNAQDNGDHEVHTDSCRFLPKDENRIYLGYHASCHSAVEKAKDYYNQVNGCIHCSKPCHTS